MDTLNMSPYSWVSFGLDIIQNDCALKYETNCLNRPQKGKNKTHKFFSRRHRLMLKNCIRAKWFLGKNRESKRMERDLNWLLFRHVNFEVRILVECWSSRMLLFWDVSTFGSISDDHLSPRIRDPDQMAIFWIAWQNSQLVMVNLSFFQSPGGS